jgi:2-oxoglutarate dehydrogenase complex dehydrogenase (E1) component-like enzyme
MCKRGEVIDWAMADALDFASPIDEGNHVRLSGQDVQRGSLSQRHLLLHDQETGPKYCPFDHVMVNQNEELFTISATGKYANETITYKYIIILTVVILSRLVKIGGF